MTYNSNLIHEEPPTMTLTKIQIVELIQNHLGLPKNKSTDIVETLLEIIKRTLASGEDVLISNFGRFCVKEKAERKGRNPATGDDLMLEPRKVVTFRCSGTLRDRVNSK
jgi:integration host factor subunit alpha